MKPSSDAQSGLSYPSARLTHTGRVAHIDNLPKGAEIVAPTAKAAPGYPTATSGIVGK